MKLIFCFSISLSILAACATTSIPFNTETPPATRRSSNVPSVVTEVGHSPPEMILNSEQSIISPQLVNKCAENQIVSFNDLKLPNDIRLLLLPNTVEAYPQIPGKPLSISSMNSTPIPIFNDEMLDYSVSPDHEWIYFNRPNSDNTHSVLWISSVDGRKQWPVIELGGEDYAGYASWVSNQEIFIIGSPHESNISVLDLWDYMPFLSVNPFTLEQHQITYLARDPQGGLFYYGAVSVDNHSLGMYGALNIVDFIYDFEQDKATSAFSWLDAVDPSDIQFTPIWVYGNGKFAITIARPDGIDFVFNLDIQSVEENKQYNDVMKRIIFPKRLLPPSVIGIIPGENLIALQRFDPFDTSQGEKWFYVLDYNSQTIYDYCFDLSDSVKRVKFSPDGKFAAFSFENFAANLEQDQHYLAILNLENGKISYLKGYTLVDWGLVMP